MGFKRSMLDRLTFSEQCSKFDRKNCVNVFINTQPEVARKITDFSIKKILSDTKSIEDDNSRLTNGANFKYLTDHSIDSYRNSINISYPLCPVTENNFWARYYHHQQSYNLGLYRRTANHESYYRPRINNEPKLLNTDDESGSPKYDNVTILQTGNTFQCLICDKVFESQSVLDQHERQHRQPRYECTECGKGFSQLRNYKYHLSVHRGTKEFAAKCMECGKLFNDKGYLSSHMKIHRNRKEYSCPHCPKSFNQRVAFNMHVRIHTGVKPHICSECGKRFSRKMLLKQHLRTHSGEKPYQCSVCGKTFADRSNMTLHHRLHSGVKPFSCPLCPKAFTKKHHLKTHLNYHTGCKPYICPHQNCGQSFTQSSNMRTHSKKCLFRAKAPT